MYWLDDNIFLPPCYGIVTSKVSESSNNMIEAVWKGTWLNMIDAIGDKSSDRINENIFFSKIIGRYGANY
jgi:hypothetical protein